MTADVKKETLGFQTEAKQLLHLMIHSLYSNQGNLPAGVDLQCVRCHR